MIDYPTEMRTPTAPRPGYANRTTWPGLNKMAQQPDGSPIPVAGYKEAALVLILATEQVTALPKR